MYINVPARCTYLFIKKNFTASNFFSYFFPFVYEYIIIVITKSVLWLELTSLIICQKTCQMHYILVAGL